MRRIAAVMGLTLATLAGPGLTGAKSAVAADAMPGSPGLTAASRSPAIPGSRLWVRRYVGPGSGDDLARSVAVSPSGDTVFVTGYTFRGTQDYTTFAYNAVTGARLWARRYNGPGHGDDQASSVAVSPSGGTVFVTGYTTGAASGTNYATIAYDAATGATLWTRRYNGPGDGDDFASSVAVSPGGGTVYVTGSSTSASPGTDYATVAYDAATGATLWVSRYHGLMYGLDGAAKVAVSPSGDMVYVTGTSIGTTTTNYDYGTVAYNAATGAQVWVSRYNGPANGVDQAASVAVSPSGDTVFVTGSRTGAGSNDDYATVAYNAATGAQVWVSRYNGPGNFIDDATSVAVSPSGGTVYVTGRSYGGTTGSDYATVAYNAATGATQWVKRYNGPGNGGDAASSLALGPGGGTVYVTGYSYGGTTGSDYATVAYNAATGARVWVSRYNGRANSTDAAYSVAVSPVTGSVFVTGISYGPNGNGDYLTAAYRG